MLECFYYDWRLVRVSLGCESLSSELSDYPFKDSPRIYSWILIWIHEERGSEHNLTTKVLWTALKMEPITFLTQAANHVPACAPFQIDIADIPGM